MFVAIGKACLLKILCKIDERVFFMSEIEFRCSQVLHFMLCNLLVNVACIFGFTLIGKVMHMNVF